MVDETVAIELFDTHCHLCDEQLEERVEEVVASAAAAGVTRILSVATEVATTRRCLALAGRFPGVWASAGIHPNYTAGAAPDDWGWIERLAAEPRVVALGETGLDRHWDDSPFDVQQDYFARHLALSRKLDKPVVIHMRDCERDMVEALRDAAREGPVRGIMHSFAGSAETAEACLALGLHVSFAGMVTYKKSDELRAIAATIPADRLLVETDSPYLSPHPHRGRRPNEPSLIVHTAQCVADARGIPFGDLARLTTENARRLLRTS